MVILCDEVGRRWLTASDAVEACGADRQHMHEDVLLVGEHGVKVPASKYTLAAVSPLMRVLLKKQGFCGGCNERYLILLPWASAVQLQEFVQAVQDKIFLVNHQILGNPGSSDQDGKRKEENDEKIKFFEMMDILFIDDKTKEFIWTAVKKAKDTNPRFYIKSMDKSSDVEVSSPCKKKSFTCKLCHINFQKVASLKEHNFVYKDHHKKMATWHKMKGEKKCVKCKMTFRNRFYDTHKKRCPGPLGKLPKKSISDKISENKNLEVSLSIKNSALDSPSKQPVEIMDIEKTDNKTDKRKDTNHIDSPNRKRKQSEVEQTEQSNSLKIKISKVGVSNSYEISSKQIGPPKPEEFASELDTSIEDDESKNICPQCNHDFRYGQMVMCMDCQQWFHCECYDVEGVPEGNDPNYEYHCSKCRGESKKTTNENKKHPCHCCSQRFITVTKMLKHTCLNHFQEKLREDSKEYIDENVCKKCDHQFTEARDLCLHLGLSHGGILRHLQNYQHLGIRVLKKFCDQYRQTEKLTYRCTGCQIQFSTMTDVDEHLYTKHLTDSDFVALGEAFTDDSDEDDHRCRKCDHSVEEGFSMFTHPCLSAHSKLLEEFIAKEKSAIFLENLLGLDADQNLIGTEEDSADTSKILQCHLCDKPFPRRTNLYKHYACTHFKDKLMEIYSRTENCKQCPFCGKNFGKRHVDALVHIGATHDVVEKFMEKEFHVKKIFSRKTKNLTEESNEVLSSETNVVEAEDVQYFKCAFCPYQNKFRKNVYSHYSLRHFKKELADKISGSSFCSLCGRKNISLTADVIHIGVRHKAVEEYLKPEFHINEPSISTNPAQTEIAEPKDKNEDNSNENDSINVTMDADTFKCRICKSGRQFSRRKGLYSHYSSIHFKKDIVKLIKDKKKCPYCKLDFESSLTKKLIHVGVCHNVVDAFLDPTYHIPRQKKSQYVDFSSAVKRKASTVSRKKSPKHCCEICLKFKTNDKIEMYQHCSMSHFKLKILQDFKDDKKCRFCDSDFKNDSDKVKHIGAFHSIVEEYMSKESIDSIVDTENKVSITEKTETEKSPAPDDCITQDKLACSVCKKSCINMSSLYKHYVSHFKRELMAKFGDATSCPFCDKDFGSNSVYNNLVHIGNTHNYVEKYLDEKYHVKSNNAVGNNSIDQDEAKEIYIDFDIDEDHQDDSHGADGGPENNIRDESSLETLNESVDVEIDEGLLDSPESFVEEDLEESTAKTSRESDSTLMPIIVSSMSQLESNSNDQSDKIENRSEANLNDDNAQSNLDDSNIKGNYISENIADDSETSKVTESNVSSTRDKDDHEASNVKYQEEGTSELNNAEINAKTESSCHTQEDATIEIDMRSKTKSTHLNSKDSPQTDRMESKSNDQESEAEKELFIPSTLSTKVDEKLSENSSLCPGESGQDDRVENTSRDLDCDVEKIPEREHSNLTSDSNVLQNTLLNNLSQMVSFEDTTGKDHSKGIGSENCEDTSTVANTDSSNVSVLEAQNDRCEPDNTSVLQDLEKVGSYNLSNEIEKTNDLDQNVNIDKSEIVRDGGQNSSEVPKTSNQQFGEESCSHNEIISGIRKEMGEENYESKSSTKHGVSLSSKDFISADFNAQKSANEDSSNEAQEASKPTIKSEPRVKIEPGVVDIRELCFLVSDTDSDSD